MPPHTATMISRPCSGASAGAGWECSWVMGAYRGRRPSPLPSPGVPGEGDGPPLSRGVPGEGDGSSGRGFFQAGGFVVDGDLVLENFLDDHFEVGHVAAID